VPTLTAEELLAGSALTHRVTLPAHLVSGGTVEAAPAEVMVRPLVLADIARLNRAAADDGDLASALMVQQALVEPRLTLEQVHRLPAGLVADHIKSLVTKADTQGKGPIDQTLLLRSLADRLRGSNGFGSFASDTLMKLGLLGTIVGFIIMLAPIAGLDAADKVAMKSSMGMMSDGMAVAMYTTLAGLVGSILVRIQYYMLDGATQRVFSDAVTLTETRVTPVLERHHNG